MLFRPEEIHGTSGIRHVVEPILKGYRCISHYTYRFCIQDCSILHFHADRRTTIQTRSINLYCFTWKKPADRQRFEPSLAEPLLLTIDSDAVLGGKVAEWRKRADVVGIGKQPGRKAGWKKLMQGFTSLLYEVHLIRPQSLCGEELGRSPLCVSWWFERFCPMKCNGRSGKLAFGKNHFLWSSFHFNFRNGIIVLDNCIFVYL